MICEQNSLPIDLVLADQLFPILESTAKSLESIPQFYENLDHFFWRNFIELFPDTDEPAPSGKTWETLIHLRKMAEFSILPEPLLHLSQNNARIGTALTALGIILKR
jgi:hypothetical protein